MVTVIPKRVGQQFSAKAGAYEWGQVFYENNNEYGLSWYELANSYY